MKTTQLKNYKKTYKNKKIILRFLWQLINILFFKTSFPFSNKFKKIILKTFGAKIGKNVIIKPNVNIKFPWNLIIGDNIWIGETVWIDNLAKVIIEDNVCISQGAMLLTGSHNYKKSTFDLITGEIKIKSGVWICAKAIVCPNVTCETHSILSVGSIATKDLEAFMIYQGNPAIIKRKREINE